MITDKRKLALAKQLFKLKEFLNSLNLNEFNQLKNLIKEEENLKGVALK